MNPHSTSILVLRAPSCAVFHPARRRRPSPATAPNDRCLISLRRAGSPVISPDAKWVAYTLRETNWDDNIYETEIWLADAQSGATRQLTNGRKSSNAPAWSPDGKKLAFGSDREDKRQIYLIDLAGGEAMKLTSARNPRRVRLGAGRPVDCLHLERAAAGGAQGAREEVRRVRRHRSGSPDVAPLRGRRRDEEGAAR